MNTIKKIKFSTIYLFLVMLYFVLCMTSCNKLDEGYVVEKWYEPTNTYFATMPVLVSNGKSTTTVLMPYSITDNEDWCVKIKGRYKNQERIETIYVSQKQYECLSIGSYFKLTDVCSISDNNNHEVPINTIQNTSYKQ